MANTIAQRKRTLLKRGQQFALVGLEDGRIEIQPLPEVDSFRLGVNEPRYVQESEHHFARAVNVEGWTLTGRDSISLQLYRVAYEGETLECHCAFDELEKVWYVRQ